MTQRSLAEGKREKRKRKERDERKSERWRRAIIGPVLDIGEAMKSKGLAAEEPRLTNGALRIPFVKIRCWTIAR